MSAPRFRRLPPAYSPLSLAALAGAAVHARAGARELLASELARRFSAERVLLAGSGTQALQLAITAARTIVGDARAAVALPAFSCFDVAAAAVGAGGPVALYDLDPETLSPDLASLERVLASGARVCVVAALYGFPVAWDEVESAAARHQAVVIEDAAQGHGGAWRGRPLGSRGRLSVLSFGRGKGWTGGGGGALLVRGVDAELPDLPDPPAAKAVRSLVASAAQWALARPRLYALPSALPGLRLGETVYHPPAEPHAISPAAAALALRTRDASDAEAVARRDHAGELLARLVGISSVEPVRPVADADPGYLRLPVRVRHDAVAAEQARALGVLPSYPHPLSHLSALAPRLSGPERRWPGAETLAETLVTLPTHSRLTATDLSAIVQLFASGRSPAVPAAPLQPTTSR